MYLTYSLLVSAYTAIFSCENCMLPTEYLCAFVWFLQLAVFFSMRHSPIGLYNCSTLLPVRYKIRYTLCFFFSWRCDPTRVMASSFLRFIDHTQRRTTVGRTHLDEWSARRRDLYLTTQQRQTSMRPVGFEPTISAGERPQTYALDRAATGTGYTLCIIRV